MGITLVVNPGSTSRKYSLYDANRVVLNFRFEEGSTGFEFCSQTGSGTSQCEAISVDEYESSFSRVAKEVESYLTNNSKELSTICVRVVAPGNEFQKHQAIDDVYIEALRKKELFVPLHIPSVLREIQTVRDTFPDVPFFAISDSAFHAGMPSEARSYSIDVSDAKVFDIYRYGYHGLSVASVVRRVHPVTGANPNKLVVCHIGGGVSVTAVADGKSIDTTMGYSPVDGLPMSSRGGDIDAGGLLALMHYKNLRPKEASMYLHTKAGLFGLGGNADIRHLLDRRTKGDGVAKQALDHFVYSIQREIAAATVALGGLDMILFTGTASSRSSVLRKYITDGLEHLGVQINEERNDTLVSEDGTFHHVDSLVKLATIRTDEMGEMARVVEQIK